ncbi:PfkB family carbohydrate kinase [Maribacter aestuarii]|uniref:PfkB family carbohydrate kinase n=1 Tax=Maribacter aestuarii TaxID=1130723 RepID=UPI0025A60C0F|nr:PfkB family carbohydrate kinase [Maribacter aestuarii]
MGKLVIVGSTNIDSIESPFGKVERIVGGSAPFIALAATQFDLDVAIVSVIGEDFPKQYLDLLAARDIDLSALEIVKGGKTFFWKGKYHNDLNSRDTLATDLNVLADFKPVVPNAYTDADVVMLGNLHPNIQLSVINQMTKRPKLIILDTMNFWMDNTLNELLNVIKHIDVLTINDEEARQLTGEYSLVKAAHEIYGMGPKYVVIKKGEHGALLFHKQQVFFAPALPLEEVFDPTGAGDTFAGGFAGFMAATDDTSFENMKKAVIHGSNLASFCVEKFGTERMVNLKREEVNKRLHQFKTLTQFEIELQ